MTGQQRANCPSQGMPSTTQAKFTQPSSAVGTGSSVFGPSRGGGGFEVQ